MARGRSRSGSRSRSPSPSRMRRSPSDFRSMTRSRSRSRSPSRSPSRGRGRPLRSKYARSSSGSRSSSPRSKKSQSLGRRPPSRNKVVPTVDLTARSQIKDVPSWLDPSQAAPSLTPDLSNPPPSFNNPLGSSQVQVPPVDGNPIPSVSQTQMRFPPPSHTSQNYDNNFQRDFAGYGSSYYSGGNPGYPDGHQMHNFSAPPGPNYAGQQMSAGGWNDYPSSTPENGTSQPGFSNPIPAGMGGLSAVIPPAAEISNANAAVEQELAQQKKKLAVEREEHFRRRVTMTKELKAIRERMVQLNEHGKTDPKISKESTKLQEDLMQKLRAIDNVIDMLTHIIGDRDQIADILKDFASALELPKKMEKPEKRRRSMSRSRSRSRSPSRKKSTKKEKKKSSTPEAKVNVVHYDPELHWCATCNVFPRSAIEYLTHLHSDVHKTALIGKKPKDKPDEEFKPWRIHEPREPSPPSYKNAPSKRVPIRGVPFLIPATAWYCSMCRTWLGDMELADRHLKGPKHASTYTSFVSQNPHWEVDWLRDRTRAYERNSEARAKVEEISKKLAGKGKGESKPQNVDIGKLTEMLVSARKRAEKLNKERSQSSSSSSSSSSDDSGDEEKKKAKKKKGKGKKKKSGDKKEGDSDKEGREGKKKKKESRSRGRSVDKKDISDEDKKDRQDDRRERPDRSDDRRDRPDRERGGYGGSSGRGGRPYQGGYRGSRPFRGRTGRTDYEPRSHDDRTSHDDRARRGREDRASSDRGSDNGDKDKNVKVSRQPKSKSPYRGQDHDWERGMPQTRRPDGAKPKVMIGKRPGLGGGISREKFGFQRKNVFDRLDKDKPDDLYGPLEPPKKQ